MGASVVHFQPDAFPDGRAHAHADRGADHQAADDRRPVVRAVAHADRAADARPLALAHRAADRPALAHTHTRADDARADAEANN